MTAPARQLSRLGTAAIRYAEQGWHVFPLQAKGKHPLIKGGGGFLSGTADVAQVRAWWTEHPNANIGLWPGQSGLCVIDLDGPIGVDWARRLGALSEPTLECTTGRADGGRHLYYKRPGFSVSNSTIAEKIDVRCDGGYVILPPSVHPSGKLYTWQGRLADILELPPTLFSAIKKAHDLAEVGIGTSAAVNGVSSARDIVFDESIGEGGRNNALTRYAGRLLAKGIPQEETLVLVSSVNQAKCKPPLPQHEVNALVAGIARRESAKPLRIVRANEPAPQEPSAMPAPEALATGQIESARELLTRDISKAPRWAWLDVDALVGAMLPGDLVVVGSLMGNGKSTLLMSQMDHFAAQRVPVLYIPLEVDPSVCRLRWAAWRLELDAKAVIRQEWFRLPEGAREAVEGVLGEQADDPFIHFAPPKRITLKGMLEWCQWAKEHVGCRVVMLDHLHRMDFGTDGANHRVNVTDAVRRLKDMARELDMVLIAAAQLNRSSDPVDAYTIPLLSRLKESAGIAEEADVALMLSRKLKRDLPEHWTNALRLGQINETDLAEPGVMTITCRKHRLDDDARDRSAYLTVHNGRLLNRPRPSLQQPTYRRWEPE